MNTIKTYFNAILSLFFPETCCTCGQAIMEGESFICLHCLCKLPQTGYHLRLSNPAEERFRGRFSYQQIAAFLHFEKGGYTQKIIHQIKYKNNEAFGIWCGHLMAETIQSSDFFSGIDVIVPVPLFEKKQKKRGFNQAEALATGIAQSTGIVCHTGLQKIKANTSQTRKGKYERWLNSQGTFTVKDRQMYAGKHILLVDDVTTTGATLESCARCLLACEGAKVSILTFAISQ